MDLVAGGRPVSESEPTSLAELEVGVTGRIATIGSGTSMRRRCLALGLRVGSVVTVLHRRGKGVVVASDGNRVALGASVAALLTVEPIDR
jgi:ferrous iron transport protein A